MVHRTRLLNFFFIRHIVERYRCLSSGKLFVNLFYFVLYNKLHNLTCSTFALPTQSTAEPYINDDSIYERLKEFAKMRGLKIIHQSINGLMRKLGMVDILLKETDRAIDIFAITETHLSRDIKDGELNLDNYTFVWKDRETGIGGGVGCFIREDIKWQRRIDLESAGLETLWLEIFVKNSKSLLICILYRPPNSSKHLHKDFESILQDMLSTGVCEDNETILLGDLNVDYLRQQNNKEIKHIINVNRSLKPQQGLQKIQKP